MFYKSVEIIIVSLLFVRFSKIYILSILSAFYTVPSHCKGSNSKKA